MKKPDNAKERGLIKGALRRVFSRSELRRAAVKKCHLPGYHDPNRPKVTKWGYCLDCGTIEPLYKMEVDHREPVIPMDTSLENMTWDELVDRLWCEADNLAPICKDCHKEKTKAETKARKLARGNKK